MFKSWAWSQGDSPQSCHVAFACPSSLSASAIRWDSIKPFSSFFSLNLFDREIFLRVPHLFPDTWDLPSLRTCCCAPVTTVRMRKTTGKCLSLCVGLMEHPNADKFCCSLALCWAHLIPDFQAQAQNTRSRPLVCDSPFPCRSPYN